MSDEPYFSEEFEPRFDNPAGQGPTFRYVIFSQQRTGSSWLARRLTNLGIFGVPTEYLNPLISINFAQRMNCPVRVRDDIATVNIRKYLGAVEKVRTSSTGRFGIKIQPNQIFPLFNGDLVSVATFLQAYDALIVLTRRDKLGQAISGAIADLTDHWRSDGQAPDLAGIDRQRLMSEIANKLAQYVTEDDQMMTVGRSMGRPVLYLTYEQMVADPDGTLEQVLPLLGCKERLSSLSSINVVEVPEPRAGHINADVRRCFLRYLEGNT